MIYRSKLYHLVLVVSLIGQLSFSGLAVAGSFAPKSAYCSPATSNMPFEGMMRALTVLALMLTVITVLIALDYARGWARLDGDLLTVYEGVFRRCRLVRVDEILRIESGYCAHKFHTEHSVVRLVRGMENEGQLLDLIRSRIPPPVAEPIS